MARSAANADGGATLTAVIARRKRDGKLVLLETREAKGRSAVIVEHELEENSDRALDLYTYLKRSKGEGGKYSAVSLFLRSRSSRRLKFE